MSMTFDPQEQMFLQAVVREVNGARKKFPGNRFNVTALGEEVGELNKAFLDHEFGKGQGADVYDEAVQVAAMAMRAALDGSHEFSYAYNPIYAETFHATGEA